MDLVTALTYQYPGSGALNFTRADCMAMSVSEAYAFLRSANSVRERMDMERRSRGSR